MLKKIVIKNLEDLKKEAYAASKSNKKVVQALKKKKGNVVDALFKKEHDKAFECIDCLKCANCCKTTGPLFTNKDIDRISKHLKMKSGKFVDRYLKLDEDADYVLQSVPCTFLGADNYCSIYDVRPKACREFPHTDRKKFHQISNLTLKNVAICPAAFNIVEEMKKRIKN